MHESESGHRPDNPQEIGPIAPVGGSLEEALPLEGIQGLGRTEHGKVLPSIEQREIDYLTRVARGETKDQIATDLFLSPKTIERTGSGIKQKWGTDSNLSSAVTAINEGIIPPQTVLEGFEMGKLADLTAPEIVILDQLVADGAERTNADLEIALRNLGEPMTIAEVGHHFERIHKKLGTKGKEQTASIYAAARVIDAPEIPTYPDKNEATPTPLTAKEREALVLRAQGYTNAEAAEEMGSMESGVKDYLLDINRKRGTNSTTNAILIGIQEGEISLTAVLGKRDPHLARELLADERAVLDALTAEDGKHSTNHEISAGTGYSIGQINRILKRVERKFETKNRFHTAAVYRASSILNQFEENREESSYRSHRL